MGPVTSQERQPASTALGSPPTTSTGATGSGDWPAPYATSPVDGVARLPGSKSLTNRYLVLAALADGSSRLRRPLRSRDTLLMAEACARWVSR